MRNKCLTIRTTDEVSKELEKYEDYCFQKSTVAHVIIERVLTDLDEKDLRRILTKFPEKGVRLRLEDSDNVDFKSQMKEL